MPSCPEQTPRGRVLSALPLTPPGCASSHYSSSSPWRSASERGATPTVTSPAVAANARRHSVIPHPWHPSSAWVAESTQYLVERPCQQGALRGQNGLIDTWHEYSPLRVLGEKETGGGPPTTQVLKPR